ncbi:MAG: SEC-C metal-binding domain-containing protein [Pseudomonadota bacterium]
MDDQDVEIDGARTEHEIFEELSELCASPGFVHVIAYLCIRDNMIRYKDEIKPEDMSNLYSSEHLVRTEINVLLGLLIKCDIDYSIPEASIFQGWSERAEALLAELHTAMTGDVFAHMMPAAASAEQGNPFTNGSVLREAIFYGGESAYSFQYRDLLARKYGRDNDWLMANKGFSIQDGSAVVKAVGAILNDRPIENMKAMRALPMEQWTYLPGQMFAAAEVATRTGLAEGIVERILTAFVLPDGERNAQYGTPLDFNMVSAFPLIKTGGQYLLFNIYNLSESFYQSPFHWMWADKPYRPTASKHRGQFTEDFSQERLTSVFGAKNVFANVNISLTKGAIAGEIDVLVVFGNLAIVLQAKSKQLTIAARKGSDKQLQTDFAQAIQASCDQGYSCAHLLLAPKATLAGPDGVEIKLPPAIKKIYVICVIADHYPALSFQSRQFLKFEPAERVSAPFVMDVFLLDAMTEMLDSPLHLLSYIDRRTVYDDKIMSSHELNILGYHLKKNLWMEEKTDLVMLHDDFGTELDLSMIVRRENAAGPWTPEGILTRLQATTLGRLVKQIEAHPSAAVMGFGFMVLTLSEDAVVDLSRTIDEMARRSRIDRKNHDVTAPLRNGSVGFTVHCNYDSMPMATRNIERHCHRRKYTSKANSWFGVCLNPDDMSLRFGLSLNFEWKFDAAMEELTRDMLQPGKFGPKELKTLLKSPKVGRNDPCPCGSGKKSKKCCHA